MKIVILSAFLISLCAINLFGQSTTAQTGFSDEEYEIWSEIYCSLDDYLKDPPLLVIQNETLPATISLESLEKDKNFISRIRDYYAKAKLKDATNELWRDFNAKNDKSYLLERNFSGCKNYVLISKSERSEIFEKSGGSWKAFEIKYPKSHGIVRFSRIGLSPDRKQAMMFLSYSCGPLCASSDYYFLVKEDGWWLEKAKLNVGMS